MDELKIVNIPTHEIRSFGGEYGKAYFSVKREKVQELEESIRNYGILEPLLVRPDPSGEAPYELLAGRTRILAAENIGMPTVPCIVQAYDGETAACVYGETNRYRESISITEKAYMLRYDEAFKAKKSLSVVDYRNADFDDEEIGDSMKRRYIRLTYLVPDLQYLVNIKRISIDAAAAASYLPDIIQERLYFALDGTSLTLTVSAVQKLRELYENKRKPFGKTIRSNEVYELLEEMQEKKPKVHISISKELVELLQDETGSKKNCEKFIEKILRNYLTNNI